ncbi:hypothetical protein C8J57DRAFT_1517360 [Mycena rebaudengoi]|nr:hypothetical protein C8J57DRAFT_1517360 [Mycena rebaudengoi]
MINIMCKTGLIPSLSLYKEYQDCLEVLEPTSHLGPQHCQCLTMPEIVFPISKNSGVPLNIDGKFEIYLHMQISISRTVKLQFHPHKMTGILPQFKKLHLHNRTQ